MIHYALSWRNTNEHLFDIAIRFIAPEDQPRLILPSWRPGKYQLQNFAANVREWTPNLRKLGPNVWCADATRGEEVEVRYRYWAGVLDAGSSYLDRSEAYFNGSNLFLWIDGLRSDECVLTVDTGWPIETQLPREGNELRARNYDHLIDSPAIAGMFTTQSFEESGASIRLVSVGCDTARFVEPMRGIVREQVAVFGELPVNEYKFLIHGGDRWHGVEHEDSCSMIVKRGAADFDEHFLSLASHEFFHLWNVKRMMPAAFAPYDYTAATPTRLLWAMEGITSYYGDLSLARSGYWSEQRYLRHLAHEIELLESSHARTHLSLAQASFDGWVQDVTRPHDRGNAWYSFYTKGEVVAALLDLTLRARGMSLDEVMRVLWAERILDEDAVRRVVDDPLFFASYVDGVEPLPYETIFALAGVRFETRRKRRALGLKVKDGVIESVASGSSGAAADLLPQDELLGVHGLRVHSTSDVEHALQESNTGDEIEVVFARNGGVMTRRVRLEDDAPTEVRLHIAEEDNALRREWLRRRG
ncbi:MAG TPA: PDZ domain-containing protein [Thermoanaerobaculia bacterium]|nr:PDZ domain-containing protein [Thermoanaerobaculia bacterium]